MGSGGLILPPLLKETRFASVIGFAVAIEAFYKIYLTSVSPDFALKCFVLIIIIILDRYVMLISVCSMVE